MLMSRSLTIIFCPWNQKKNYAVLEIYADCEYFQKYLVADINI